LPCASIKACKVSSKGILEDEGPLYGAGYDLGGCAGGWFSNLT